MDDYICNEIEETPNELKTPESTKVFKINYIFSILYTGLLGLIAYMVKNEIKNKKSSLIKILIYSCFVIILLLCIGIMPFDHTSADYSSKFMYIENNLGKKERVKNTSTYDNIIFINVVIFVCFFYIVYNWLHDLNKTIVTILTLLVIIFILLTVFLAYDLNNFKTYFTFFIYTIPVLLTLIVSMYSSVDNTNKIVLFCILYICFYFLIYFSGWTYHGLNLQHFSYDDNNKKFFDPSVLLSHDKGDMHKHVGNVIILVLFYLPLALMGLIGLHRIIKQGKKMTIDGVYR